MTPRSLDRWGPLLRSSVAAPSHGASFCDSKRAQSEVDGGSRLTRPYGILMPTCLQGSLQGKGKSIPVIRRVTVIEQSPRGVRKRPVNFHA